MKEITHYLKQYRFYNKLSITERELLEQSATQLVIANNKELQSCETIHNGLILVIKGQLSIYLNLANGRQMALFNIYDNQYTLFYDQALIVDQDFDVSVSIDHEITIIHIERSTIQYILNTNHEVSTLIFQRINQNLVSALKSFEKRISLPLTERIMHFIDKQIQIQKTHALKLSHERIANELGSSREVITKILNDLAKHNKITLKKGMIIVHNT